VGSLLVVHGTVRRIAIALADVSRLYLNDHRGAPVKHYQVGLIPLSSPVARKQLAAVLAEELKGDLLAPGSRGAVAEAGA
jgi:hypothetical protein